MFAIRLIGFLKTEIKLILVHPLRKLILFKFILINSNNFTFPLVLCASVLVHQAICFPLGWRMVGGDIECCLYVFVRIGGGTIVGIIMELASKTNSALMIRWGCGSVFNYLGLDSVWEYA